MRQVRLLESRFKVTVSGFGVAPDAQVEFVGISRRPASLLRKVLWAGKLLMRLSESYYWDRPEIRLALAALGSRKFDLVIANDIAALPLALRLSQERPVLMDAHEYSPLEFEDNWRWRLLFGKYQHDLCRRYLPRAGALTTVCQGIADEYADHFGVAPVIVENAPPLQDLHPSAMVPGRIRIVHHGAAIRSRHLEDMIETMRHLDGRFTLDFMLVGSDVGYLRELREFAAGDMRIRFVPPVPMTEICTGLNHYDLGMFLLPPVNFNYRHALPNKFFEFVQARLGVAIGPSPEMARLVNLHGLGVVAESFAPAELARHLNQLTADDIQRFKLASNRAAESLNFAASADRLLALVDRLLALPGSATGNTTCGVRECAG